MSSKSPIITIIIRFFDNSHLKLNRLMFIYRYIKIFTVKKSTFRITFANANGRNFPPHNLRVHVSKLGA